MKLTAAFIYVIAPAAKPEIVNALVADQVIMDQWGITSTDDICYFLGQCATETQGFTRLEENLFYTSTRRLREVWPSRFKTDAAALPYVRNPQKLANLVYGGRLGNVAANDGWNYRGSGMKQTTGLYNYTLVQTATGIKCVSNPGLLRGFPEALTSACVYWSQNKLARFVAANDVKGLTKAVQGGTGGLADRITYTNRAMIAARGQMPMGGAQQATSDRMLRHGSTGPLVKQLQGQLAALGYEPGRVDGLYGDGTEAAVKLFQAAHGLVADGVAGPKTLAMLEQGNAEPRVLPTLREPSGLDKFIIWLMGLIKR